MSNSLTQRIGPNTKLLHYPETTRGSDPGGPLADFVPLRDQEGFAITRDEIEAPYYNGTSQGVSSAPGQINAGGPVPASLDFIYVGNVLKMPVGSSGYTNTALVTGRIHQFAMPAGVTTALSAQLQKEWGETTTQYERARYCMLKSLATSYASGGAAPLDLNFMSAGDIQFTDLAGTKTDNGLAAVSVFNGQARLAVAALAPTWFVVQPTAFSLMWDTMLEVQPAAFNDGVAVSLNQGIPKLSGNLELAFAADGSNPENNFTFDNYAINRTLMSYECVWTDQAFAASPFPSSWLQLEIASLRLNRRDPSVGGKAGRKTSLAWNHVLDATLSKIPGQCVGTVAASTYNVTGSNNIFTMKFDGGGNVAVTLTTGATRTGAQIVADLNGNGPFAAAAVADVFCGCIRVRTKQATLTGASSSVQFVTGQANGSETLLGFNNTVFSGFNAPYAWRLRNARSASY